MTELNDFANTLLFEDTTPSQAEQINYYKSKYNDIATIILQYEEQYKHQLFHRLCAEDIKKETVTVQMFWNLMFGLEKLYVNNRLERQDLLDVLVDINRDIGVYSQVGLIDY